MIVLRVACQPSVAHFHELDTPAAVHAVDNIFTSTQFGNRLLAGCGEAIRF
jgi:hypothetical protein